MSTIKGVLSIVMLVLLSRKVYSKGCEKTGEVWICRDVQLETNKKLPITEVNLNVKNIKFENCIIPTVPSGVLNPFKNVKDIDVENSLIRNITPGAFDGLTQLNKIHLRKNEISEIKAKVFNSLVSVKELNLHYNYINSLESGCFTNMAQLEILRLGWNKLTCIPENVFVSLRSLKYLFLNDNLISRLAVGSFRDLPALYQLNLDHNVITELEFGTFSKTSNLGVLALGFNNISKINEDIFHDFNSLNNLYINNNNLSLLNFERLLVYTPKLKKISLNNNTWSCNTLSDNLLIFNAHNIIVSDNDTELVHNLRGIKCTPKQEATTENVANFEKFEQLLNKKLSDTNFIKNIHSSLFNTTTDYINLIFLKHFEEGFKNTTFFKYFQHDFSNSSFFKQLDEHFLKLLNYSETNVKNMSLKTPKDFNNDINSLHYFSSGTFVNVCLVIIIVILLVATIVLVCILCRIHRHKTFLVNSEEPLL